MERDSAEASLLAEVIAAEAEAESVRHDVAFYRGAEDVERQLGRVASVLDTLHATASRYRVTGAPTGLGGAVLQRVRHLGLRSVGREFESCRGNAA